MKRPAKRRGQYRHPEQCRFCGCTEETACQLIRLTIAITANDAGRPTFHNEIEACSWRDATKRACTNPDCMAKELIRRKGR